jgi:predicted small integral membrane protein
LSKAIDFAAKWVDRISESYRVQPTYLGIVRILFGLHVLIFPVGYAWTAEAPASFFQPRPGLFAWMTASPDLWFMVLLEIARATLAVVVLVGFKTLQASIALTVVMIVGAGITHSFGKLDHFILYELFPAFMAFARWGAALSIDARFGRARASRGFPMLLWAVTVAYALFTAALPKAVAGWLDPAKEASRGFIARDIAENEKLGPFVDTVFAFDNHIFWKFMDYATIFAEGWLIIAVLFPVLFRLGIVALLAFHAGVFMSLGIDFASYFFLYAVFFSPAYVWLMRRVSRKQAKHKQPATT